MVQPRDTLNLRYYLCRINGTSWNFYSVWLHHLDSDYKMKLSDGASGTYYGEYDQANALFLIKSIFSDT